MGSKTAGSVGGVGPQQPQQQQQMGDVPAFPMPQMQPMPGAAPAGMGDVNYYGNSVLPPGPLNPAPGGAAPAGMGDVNYYGNSVLPFGGDQRAIEDALRLAQQQMGQSQPVPDYKESGSMFVPPEVSGRRSTLNPFFTNRPGMSPVKPVSPIPPPMGDTGPLRPKRPINPLLPAGYGFDPRGKRQDMGLTPPAGFPQGLDYNKMPPSVRDMFAPRPAQPAPKPQITNQGPGIGLAPPALPAGLDYNTMPPSVRSMFAPRR